MLLQTRVVVPTTAFSRNDSPSVVLRRVVEPNQLAVTAKGEFKVYTGCRQGALGRVYSVGTTGVYSGCTPGALLYRVYTGCTL